MTEDSLNCGMRTLPHRESAREQRSPSGGQLQQTSTVVLGVCRDLDQAAAFQAAHSLLRGGNRQPGSLGQLGEAHAAVAGQQRDDGAVDLLHVDTVALDPSITAWYRRLRLRNAPAADLNTGPAAGVRSRQTRAKPRVEAG